MSKTKLPLTKSEMELFTAFVTAVDEAAERIEDLGDAAQTEFEAGPTSEDSDDRDSLWMFIEAIQEVRFKLEDAFRECQFDHLRRLIDQYELVVDDSIVVEDVIIEGTCKCGAPCHIWHRGHDFGPVFRIDYRPGSPDARTHELRAPTTLNPYLFMHEDCPDCAAQKSVA